MIKTKYIIFSMLLILSGCDSKTNINKSSQTYQLSTNEATVLRTLLIDEIDISSNNGEVSGLNLVKKILGEYSVVTSSKLQKDYEKNEVKADLTYRKKTLLIKGKVLSIDRGIGEDYFISLNGGDNMFIHPKVNMAKGYTEYLADLEKGDIVGLSCVGNGMLLGSAMAKECEPLFNYANRKISDYLKELNVNEEFIKNQPEEASLVLMSLAINSKLSENTACFTIADQNHEKCLKEIKRMNIMKKDSPELIKEMEKQLIRIGLKKEEVALK